MIRVILLILLTTISAYGQDAALVREFCDMLGKFSDSPDLKSQVSKIAKMTDKYLERNPAAADSSFQDRLRFQYQLQRELMRSCRHYPIERIRLTPKTVIDLENKLTKQQIDSLGMLTSRIIKDKKVYLYIVTVDDFYPDSTIADFSNRYREFWVPRAIPEKGVVLIIFSTTQKQVRISTGDTSMTYLTDDECSEVNKTMIPHFRVGKYFDGLVDGLLAIESRL
jgi:hypothetical protein